MDALWNKPSDPLTLLQEEGWEYDEAILVDDEPFLRKAAERAFHKVSNIRVLGPDALPELVALKEDTA